MIAGDNPLVSFLPMKYHRELLLVLSDLKTGDKSSLNLVKGQCSELHSLLQNLLEDTEALQEACLFFEGLIRRIEDTFRGKSLNFDHQD